MNRTGTHEYLDALLKRSVSVFISTVNVGNLYHKIVGSLLVFFPPSNIFSCLYFQFVIFFITLLSHHIPIFSIFFNIWNVLIIAVLTSLEVNLISGYISSVPLTDLFSSHESCFPSFHT